MRDSFRSSSSRLFAAIGTGALLVLVIVLVTGGFVLQAGPLRLSARRWLGPLFLTLGGWSIAALHGRVHLRGAAASIAPFIERHALAIAVISAVAAAGAGVAFGTHAASSADAAGYVSQAHLITTGTLLQDQPLAREMGWPDATWSFSPLGYRPGVNAGEIAPTYPPGLPLLMAASLLLVGEEGPYLVVPALGTLAVLCAYVLGAQLHSRLAGVIAAALLATSPIMLFQIVQPMSDVAVMAWWTLAVVLAHRYPFPAGAATGLALLTRPNLLPLTLLVAAVVGWRRLGLLAAGALPAAGALALVQWRLYGSPLASGYGSLTELFAMDAIPLNARAYASRFLDGEAPALVLATMSAIAIAVARPQPDAPVASVRSPVTLAAIGSALVLACYLPYAVFAEWSYLRFLLPAFPFLFVAVGALAAAALSRFPAPGRGVLLLVVLTLTCSLNVVTASRQQAFNLRVYEQRYRSAGRYLAASLPANAVLVTAQQSASASHYTGKPIVRWDLLPLELDTAIAALRARGRHPVLLVEDWETTALAARFPGSTLARVDWRPRADFGAVTRVRLYDPIDRGAAPAPLDRVP